MRTVILGSGFGGIYTAHCLLSSKRMARRLDISLISRSSSFEFKPLFIDVLGGRLRPESAMFSLDSIFGNGRCRMKAATITGIDAKKRVVETDRGNVEFDYLVIALGGYPDFVPLTRGASLLSLESLEECVRLRDRITRLKKMATGSRRKKGGTRNAITIIGAGPTGVETALEIRHILGETESGGTTSDRRSPIDISLIESAEDILPGWGSSFRIRAESLLEECGVNVVAGAPVARIGKGRIFFDDRASVGASDIIWCGGLRGLPLCESIGSPMDGRGRVQVDARLRIPEYPNIFVLGDAVSPESFTAPVPQSAQAAYQQAQVIAQNILNGMAGKPPQRFAYVELGEVMPIGGRRATVRILGVPLEGHLGWVFEKAVFLARVPGCGNKAALLNSIALEPLVERGEDYLERRGW